MQYALDKVRVRRLMETEPPVIVKIQVERLIRDHHLTEPCPTCPSEVGVMCVYPDGRERPTVHTERFEQKQGGRR